MFIERFLWISVVPSVFTRSFFPFLSLHLLPLLEVRIFFSGLYFETINLPYFAKTSPQFVKGSQGPNSLSLENPRSGFYPHRVLIHLPFNPRSYDLTNLTQLKCCVGSVNINTHLKTCMEFNNQYTDISHPKQVLQYPNGPVRFLSLTCKEGAATLVSIVLLW